MYRTLTLFQIRVFLLASHLNITVHLVSNLKICSFRSSFLLNTWQSNNQINRRGWDEVKPLNKSD